MYSPDGHRGWDWGSLRSEPRFPWWVVAGVWLALSAAPRVCVSSPGAGARAAGARLGIQALGCGVLLDHMLACGQGFSQNLLRGGTRQLKDDFRSLHGNSVQKINLALPLKKKKDYSSLCKVLALQNQKWRWFVCHSESWLVVQSQHVTSQLWKACR